MIISKTAYLNAIRERLGSSSEVIDAAAEAYDYLSPLFPEPLEPLLDSKTVANDLNKRAIQEIKQMSRFEQRLLGREVADNLRNKEELRRVRDSFPEGAGARVIFFERENLR